MSTDPKALARFLDQITPEPNSGCWIWLGSLGHGGYGQFMVARQNYRAHRWAYEHLVGPIPHDTPQLDHKCRVRCCVNPAHLEPVTNKQNVLRGEGVTAENAVKTHCPQGHPLSGNNLRFLNGTWRACRQCHREWQRGYRARRRNAKREAS